MAVPCGNEIPRGARDDGKIFDNQNTPKISYNNRMIKKISKLSWTWKIIYGIAALIVLWGIYHFWFAGSGNQYQFVTVTRGTITEAVNVTGNTTPVQNLSLAFQNGGTITSVDYPVGSHVNAGTVIARLDTEDLQAQLAQAQANVDSAAATLANLQAGATPQNIAVSQAALASAQQTLQNTYSGVSNTLESGYSSANDAVRNQLNAMFYNPETNNPQLAFTINNSQIVNNIELERVQAAAALNSWQSELAGVTTLSSSSTLDGALADAAGYLATVKTLLNSVSNAVTIATTLPPATATAYKNSVTAGTNEVDTTMTTINTAIQSIASQKIAITQAEAQLNLTLAGSTAQAIAAQAAQVEQTKATMQGVQVKINEASLVSPIDGVITTQDAKVGEVASPGAVLVSVISSNNLEVDADVAEVDIGKVSVGDPVDMTFDAFPNETFTGKVFYVNPGETIVSGVVDYLVKVSFDKVDPRMKSGLTANLTILTQTKQNVLLLPQFAIIQNASGTFVETLNGKVATTVPITLGIEDQSGTVEIATGVTEGEQVINIGLKQ
jgi:HlyD family secretion protein